MKVVFASPKLPKTGALAASIIEGGKFSPTAARLDEVTAGALTRAIKNSRFKGKKGQVLEILAPPGLANSRILLVGVGKPGALVERDLENLGGSIVGHLAGSGEGELTVMIDPIKEFSLAASQRAARVAVGMEGRQLFTD